MDITPPTYFVQRDTSFTLCHVCPPNAKFLAPAHWCNLVSDPRILGRCTLVVREGNKQGLVGKDPPAQSVTLNTFLLPWYIWPCLLWLPFGCHVLRTAILKHHRYRYQSMIKLHFPFALWTYPEGHIHAVWGVKVANATLKRRWS